MKRRALLALVLCLSGCNSYMNRPVQDQVVGGDALLDAVTGRDRVGVLAKQAQYDSFVAKPKLNPWGQIPVIGLLARNSVDYEVCAAPPADAMASVASSLAAAVSGEGGTTVSGTENIKATLQGSLAESFANSLKSFSFRSQGLQYIRDAKFNNCITWINRGKNLTDAQEAQLLKDLMAANALAEARGFELIKQELTLRGKENSGFNPTEVNPPVSQVQGMQDKAIEQVKKLADIVKPVAPSTKDGAATPPAATK